VSNYFLTKRTAQSGFTLVEIAIVLVIIGLLLGGVLKGQELINSAKVRGLNDQVSGITAAWYAFQDRYRAIPGDYNLAQVNIDGGLVNGQGNGLVNTNQERGQLWAHLSAAGLINGSYSGAAVGNANYRCNTAICADNGFGAGILITFSNEGQSNTGFTNELISGSNIPVGILAELDRKIDDGSADAGSMQLGNGGGGWGGGASGACLNGSAYQVLTPSDNCAAVFRNL